MADDGIFATTAEVQRKVGANASTTSNVESHINQFMAEAESYINVVTGVNYSDSYTSLNADVRDILKMVASNLAAIMVINYDMTGFATRLEVQTRIDVLYDAAQSGLRLLKEKKGSDFVTGA